MSEPTRTSPMVRVPSVIFAALLREVRTEGDPSEVAARLRELGVEAAGAYSALLRERLGDDPGAVPADHFWVELGTLLQEMGLGTLEHASPHPGVLALSSPDWVEAAENGAEYPSCHFSTGLLAELVRDVAGADLAAVEVECRSSGAARCHFLLGSPAAVDAVFGEMSQGREFQDALAALT